MRLLLPIALAALVSLVSPTSALAGPVLETGSFLDVADGTSVFSGDVPGGGFFFAAEPVTGINKFDPSLGTLTSILLTAEFDAEAFVDIFAESVTDDTSPHETDAMFEVPFFIGYSPSSSPGSTFTVVGDSLFPFASCFGDSFDPPCSDFGGDSNFVSGSSELIGTADLADFVGAGTVDSLRAIIAIPDGADFFLDNVDTASANLTVDMLFTSLTVEYVFDQAPEPAVALLLAPAALAMARRRRER